MILYALTIVVRWASDPNVHKRCPTGLEALQDAYSKTATIEGLAEFQTAAASN